MRRLLPPVSRFVALACFAVLLVATAACNKTTHPREPQASLAASAMATNSNAYTLGPGDRLRIKVFNEQELSGEFDVDSVGKINMPLVGEIPVAKMTIAQVTNSIVDKLNTGYLRDPKVSVEVMNYRPFFILGEVMKPGNYPYVNGMTAVNAVAVAGGYTYRADKDSLTVVRAGDQSKTEYQLDETGAVYPGDVVRVPERFF